MRRRRLTQRGLSSGKKRRTQPDGRVVGTLDRSGTVRYAIYGAFAVIVCLLVLNAPRGNGLALEPPHEIVASLISVVMAVMVFEMSHRRVAGRNGQVLLVFGGLAAHLALVGGAGAVVEGSGLSASFELLLISYAFAPLIHSVLLGTNVGVYSVACVSVLGSFLVPREWMLAYLMTSLFCGVTVVYVTREMRKRGRLLRAGIYAGAAAWVLACAFDVISVRPLVRGGVEDWEVFGIESVTVIGIGVVTAMIVSGLLPLLEDVFSLTTDISWLELSDLNHKLLRRMQLEAPGTFHHSLVVASLSEAAAEAIGAHTMICRVCSLFHDIGKLNKPEYFIENQGEENPHDALTPTMSALILIAHVKDGVDMAIKHKLNPRIVDVIREHHGDSLVYYFYRKAQGQRRQEEEKVEEGLENPEDLPSIDEKNFRYPGPCPRTRESGIISLADAVESASRSLQKPTPQKIRTLVDDIVFNRIKDGQLDRCGLTVKELKTLRESFAKTLRSMLHSRIEYPRQPGQAEKPRENETRKSEAGTNGRPPAGDARDEKVVPVEELERHRQKAVKRP